MKNENKIIMIDGDSSKWYAKAIFILNPSHIPPVNVVAEAEKIINNHFLKKYSSHMPLKKNIKNTAVKRRNQNGKLLDYILSACIILCVILIGIIIYSFA